jgi:preprotein translocase subunit SecG
MAIFSVLAVSFIMKIVAALFLFCCVVLILTVLIQKGRGGGLSSAIAGGVASGILGSKTGDFLTWVTIVLVGIFLSMAVLMARFYKPVVSQFGSPQPVQQQQPSGQKQPTSTVPTTTSNEGTTTPVDMNSSTDSNSPGS